MHIIDVIREQEANDAFLLREEFGTMTEETFENIKGFIEAEQDTAWERLQDVPVASPNEIGWHQNILLAEIALQLAKFNEHLSKMANPPMQYANEDEAMQAFLAEQQYRREAGQE